MTKKVIKSKKVTAKEVVNVCGEYLPDEVASVFHLYYDSFLKQGFTTEQSFLLTRQVANFYLQ